QDDARYGFRCCHLKNIWTAPLPPETELSRQMTTSTTSIDIMGLQAAYANLHTDQERDYFMQRYHDVISSFGGKTSYDADNRPLLVMRSNLWASGYDVDGTQAVATSQEAVQNQNEPQLRDENAHNDKSVHGVLNPTYQAGLRRDAVQPDIEAERKKRDEIEAGKSYCSRRFGGATCDDKSAQIYARFDKNDWRIQPAEFYRFHDAEVNTFGYF